MEKHQLDKDFWNQKYIDNTTGWDMGQVSPPIKTYIDTLDNKDIAILIPGAGNAYEAVYLLARGFTNITVIDIASTVIEKHKNNYQDHPNIQFILRDFFEHKGKYDLILEQTFFCAISPTLRDKYVEKTFSLLNKNGRLCGLLFNKEFQGGPPFGGTKEEYLQRFNSHFTIHKMEDCYNSHPARQGSELWIDLRKKDS